ncbi:hypothetical protein OIU84_006846 [Salix udensis]|uniref:Tubby C-terminal domain-containing protein n=1 Tax=Salix udensis TaxID=889485 RepID=A0AAD6K088_9ROSI|nr:hypothetical protein OIU84_006846 [Salix udensis]
MSAIKSIINRSRSHRVVQYSSAPDLSLFGGGCGAETTSCWANLPQELLREPGPRDFLLQCFIKRCRSTQTYRLYLSLNNALTEDGKFLLAARKCRRPTCTDYIISLDTNDMSKGSNTYVGKLRSNFLGTKFTVFDGQPPHAGARMTKSRSSRLVNLKQVILNVTTKVEWSFLG